MLAQHVIFSYHNHPISKQAVAVSACRFLSPLVSGTPLNGFSSPAQLLAIIETNFRITLSPHRRHPHCISTRLHCRSAYPDGKYTQRTRRKDNYNLCILSLGTTGVCW